MRRFYITQERTEPNVIAEVRDPHPLRELRGAYGNDHYSEEELRSVPELSAALDRWNAKDTSSLDRQRAIGQLHAIAEDWIGLPSDVETDERLQFQDSEGPECALVVEAIDDLLGIVRRIEALVGTDHSADWWTSPAMIELEAKRGEDPEMLDYARQLLAAKEGADAS